MGLEREFTILPVLSNSRALVGVFNVEEVKAGIEKPQEGVTINEKTTVGEVAGFRRFSKTRRYESKLKLLPKLRLTKSSHHS